MQLLSSCSRVLTSLRYQDGYCGCRGSQRYQQCLNSSLQHPNSDCVEFKKMEKRAKNEKSRFAKNTFLFLRAHDLDIILGVITDRKNRVGQVCPPKKFFYFLSPVKVRNFGKKKCWNMFPAVRQSQQYPIYRLGVLKNPWIPRNTEKMQK